MQARRGSEVSESSLAHSFGETTHRTLNQTSQQSDEFIDVRIRSVTMIMSSTILLR